MLAGPVLRSGPASESTAVASGLQYTGSPDLKASARLEWRRSTSGDTRLASSGVAYKISSEWTALAKALWTEANAANTLTKTERSWQAGLAYRQLDANRVNALLRVEDRLESGSTDALNTNVSLAPAQQRHLSLLSGHINVELQPGTQLSGRLAAKRVVDRSGGLNSREDAQLLGLRSTHDLSAQWDVGIQALLWLDRRSRQQGLGLEFGNQLVKNLWLSAGYNVMGFSDRELAGAEPTQAGIYLRLRFKFDEALF